MADEVKEPILTIKLSKGLADRNRLPLAHVLSVLEEFRQMLAEIGRRLQRERGAPQPSGEFGLEILATSGMLLQHGSVQAPIAITNNIHTGVLAAQELIRTLDLLEREDGTPDPNVPVDRTLIRRVARLARIQKADKTDLNVSLDAPGFSKPMKASFGAAGRASIKALQSPTFEVEGASVYGKLVELVDRDPSEEDGRCFWGELRRENGEALRVQFRQRDIQAVTPLFRKQVVVSGRIVYYRVANPKIIAETITADADRDYEAAFDELFGAYRDAFGTDTKTLINRLREE
ncbi:MAG: hypothetical protein K2X35_24205 [Bryobacteraceae bacterium]|nr:hypothetical protein [Bryobacteraceae bacterium]